MLSTAGEGEGKVNVQLYQRLKYPPLKAVLYVIVVHLLVWLVKDRAAQL